MATIMTNCQTCADRKDCGLRIARENYDCGTLPPCRFYKAVATATRIWNQPESPYIDDNVLACPFCGSGEYLHNGDGNRNTFCGQCGQAIDWEADQ